MSKNYVKKLQIPALVLTVFGLASCTIWDMVSIPSKSKSSKPYIDYGDSGYSIMDTSKTMTYAEINGSTGAVNIPSVSDGTTHILVIPVQISGWSFDRTFPNWSTDLNNALNGDGEADTGYWESVASYYKKSSYGKLNLQFDIAPVYDCGYTAKGLYDINSSGEGKGSITVLKNAVENLRTTKGNDYLKRYDYDEDGWLDGVIMIYSCPDFQKSTAISSIDGSGDLYWAYCYWGADTFPTEEEKKKPVGNLYFWASASFLYTSSVKSPRCDAHTFIHEFGHMLGLDDYYAVMGEDGKYESYNPAGGWIMEDHNILDHDIWSKTALHWTSPYVVRGDTRITIKPSEVNGDCIILPSDSFNETPFSEYLIMELYTPTGLNYLDSHEKYDNKYLGYNAVGIRLWHIDARLAKRTYSQLLNKYTWSYYNSAELADGQIYRVAASNSQKVLDIASNYSLISLIDAKGKNDFRNKLATNDSLFKTGDSFSFSTAKYQKYFPKKTKFNNGTTSSVTIDFENVTADEATICFTF